MDLLGKKEVKKEVVTKAPVSIHVPIEEEKKKSEDKKIEPAKQEVTKKIVGEDIDLAENERRKLKIKRRVLYSAIIILLVSGLGWGVFWFISQPPKLPVVTTPPVAEPVTIPPVTQPPVSPPVVTQPPVVQEPAQPGVLPDTALAPLRGALVKFQASDNVFLIENNGELRLVNPNTTVFQNGKKLNQINKTLIYQLPDKWSNIRKGAQEVSGNVDFDPRVLKLNELTPFIQ